MSSDFPENGLSVVHHLDRKRNSLSVSISLVRLRVHDQSSNKVMSPGQDHNPVHSPPMIELGLEGLFHFFYDGLLGRSN